jgi:hypothetical protein
MSTNKTARDVSAVGLRMATALAPLVRRCRLPALQFACVVCKQIQPRATAEGAWR